MRAVLIATGQSAEDVLLSDRYPVPMLPLVDRPFLQHVVEYLVAQGVRVFDWILCHHSEEIEEFLGGGQRWGATFRYHLVSDPVRPYARLRALAAEEEDGLIVFGHADRLPAIRLSEMTAGPDEAAAVLYGARAREGTRTQRRLTWSGWAVLTPAAWQDLPWGEEDEAALCRRIGAGASCLVTWREVPRPLSVRTFAELRAGHGVALRGEHPGLLVHGKEVEEGVWLSRNVRIHPSASLVPPVYLGENCEVGEGARLGPQAFVGRDCVIDHRAALANSVVLPGSYVGEGLEAEDALVDRDRLARCHPGGLLRLEEQVPVACLTESSLPRRTGQALSMGLGLCLLLLAAPVLLLTALWLKLWRGGRVLHARRVVRLPAFRRGGDRATFSLWSFSAARRRGDRGQAGEAGWRHLFLDFLPGLVNVARGDLGLVGLPPRTPAEVEQLGPDWQALYLRGKAGLVSEVLLHLDDLAEEEVYALEGVYAVTGGSLRDLGLLTRYLLRVLFGRGQAAPALSDRTTGGEPCSSEGSYAGQSAAAVLAVAAAVSGGASAED
jgi:lipopolysaccharide/colanic/teichoic acid biosynthesis glycosyltransferase